MIVAGCSGAHRHGERRHAADTHRLFVEVTPEGSRKSNLRSGAHGGLAKIPFARSVDDGGDVELQVELAGLDVSGSETVCNVKILVFRLPQHDLLGIADGAARARGTGREAGNDCIETLGATLVRGKVRPLLERQLHAKR
ncbi:MAG TPA: hypothetical protein VFQ53_18350 [Kofleriaceae bacterium]|nr:hypothetical protein [Kofleriaceae bacterium]